jgi:hypothetical protein
MEEGSQLSRFRIWLSDSCDEIDFCLPAYCLVGSCKYDLSIRTIDIASFLKYWTMSSSSRTLNTGEYLDVEEL